MFLRSVIVSLLLACYCHQIMANESQLAQTNECSPWGAMSRASSDGCTLVTVFSCPEMEDGICVVNAMVSSQCPIESSKSNLVQSRESHIKYLGILPADVAHCTSLSIETDFFPESAAGADRFFVEFLVIASRLLKSEATIQSDELYELGPEIKDHIITRQMSLLSRVDLSYTVSSSIDRYDVKFYIPERDKIVVLSVNEDGTDPEWGLMVE